MQCSLQGQKGQPATLLQGGRWLPLQGGRLQSPLETGSACRARCNIRSQQWQAQTRGESRLLAPLYRLSQYRSGTRQPECALTEIGDDRHTSKTTSIGNADGEHHEGLHGEFDRPEHNLDVRGQCQQRCSNEDECSNAQGVTSCCSWPKVGPVALARRRTLSYVNSLRMGGLGI